MSIFPLGAEQKAAGDLRPRRSNRKGDAGGRCPVAGEERPPLFGQRPMPDGGRPLVFGVRPARRCETAPANKRIPPIDALPQLRYLRRMTHWLDTIHLITFDNPGVLFDWRAGLHRAGVTEPADIARFVTRLEELAVAEPFRRWSDVVRQALTDARGDLRPAIVGLFAADLGRLPTWPDALPALHTLREVLQVGLVANGDAQHQLDAAQTCKTRWDVCVSSEELRAHLQTERAWDATVRAGITRAAVTRDAWLHVSTSERTLELAKARGLRTCLVQRPGTAGQVQGDLKVADLHDLTQQVLAAKRGPLLVEISVSAPEPVREKLADWLRDTLLPAMRRVPGVRSARLYVREDGALLEQYTFGSAREVAEWQAAFAAEQRALVREAFGPDVVRQVQIAVLRGAA